MSLSLIETSKKALLNNIAQIKKKLTPQQKFMAVVKANAYGHGLLEVVGAIKNKVDYFAVYDFNDALLLRKKKISQPILVLGRTLPSQISLALKHDLEITVSTFDLLEELSFFNHAVIPAQAGIHLPKSLDLDSRLRGNDSESRVFSAKEVAAIKKCKLKIHLCIESGMGRDGFVFLDLPKILTLLKNKNIEPVGLYSHLSSADEKKFDAHSKKQVAELLKWKKALNEIGLKPLVHLAASSGVFIPKIAKAFDLVRVGLSLYGLWPSNEVKKFHQKETNLQPVLSWRAMISEIKFLPKGSAISYGCTHILQRDSKIAILPIGYFDGISRVSSSKGFVLINGKKVPQLGRVTMNIIVIDVTDVVTAKIGDVATIIGRDGDEEITADDWAAWSATSNYEIVTRINSGLARVVT